LRKITFVSLTSLVNCCITVAQKFVVVLDLQVIKKCPVFMEPEGSSPWSQEPRAWDGKIWGSLGTGCWGEYFCEGGSSRRMEITAKWGMLRWAGHVAHMQEMRNAFGGAWLSLTLRWLLCCVHVNL